MDKPLNKRRKYQRLARLYDLLDLPFEFRRYQPMRREMWQGLKGDILDAGVGTGRNMAFYPEDARVTGIDLSAAMLAQAHIRKEKLGTDVTLMEADIMDTGLADDSFDAIVASFLFCVLESDQQLPALRELGRICRPGSEIRILEYAISENPMRRFVMALWAPWVWLVYGAGFDRRTEEYVAKAGLDLVEVRYLFSDIVKMLVIRPR
ncbi:MAG: class I SAM-dependent methyltransferase [Rhodospirillales bacterium]|nr:class I SAM-dependent methyltransferase [Rhodospirillales bacterium]